MLFFLLKKVISLIKGAYNVTYIQQVGIGNYVWVVQIQRKVNYSIVKKKRIDSSVGMRTGK